MTADLDYIDLNALVSVKDENGNPQPEWDKEAARQYFLQHVNQNTVFFHSIEEKLKYLFDKGYYEVEMFAQYNSKQIKDLYKQAYSHKFRFPSFMGALKYYTQYTLKTFDGKRYLERYEDRVVAVSLGLAKGDYKLAQELVDKIITGQFQPATPTFLNMGKAQRGELTSCFLLQIQDNMESISKAIDASLQLSKRGGGVAFCLTSIRAYGDPIKKIKNRSSGVVPIMKILEDCFSYANQLGARQGSGAVYLNAHHPDIMKFLDTKKENADEKVRIKTLSTGVVIPDVTFELAKNNEDMYLFSPYDVEKEYGKPMAEISITEMYDELCRNPNIEKTRLNARDFFSHIASLQTESGYPYIMFEDNANRQHNNQGWLNMSNLCVAPETPILTREGYLPIGVLKDEPVEVWNGQEWSETTVIKTADKAKLIRVHLSDGSSIDCTPQHDFYVKENYRKNAVKVKAEDLKSGDKLEKFDLPLDCDLETGILMDDNLAYSHGFYCGDGNEDYNFSWVYEPKVSVIPRLIGKVVKDVNRPRHRWDHGDKLPQMGKHTIPGHYARQSRLQWLAGLFDADATVISSDNCDNIQLCSVKSCFLKRLKLFLQELGVNSSISLCRPAGTYMLPKNDGSGKSCGYNCQDVWRLNINGEGVKRLLDQGLHTSRLKFKGTQAPQREASKFITVTSIEDTGRESPTFCFREEKRHKGMFNGVLTGQCVEIMQYSEASTYNEDGSYKHVGRDISCNLGSMNIAKAVESKDIGKSVETAVKALSNVTEMTNLTAIPSIAKGNDYSHSIGLGQMNLHGFLAKNHIEYGSEEALEFVDLYFYTVAYHAVRTSCMLAKEKKKYYYGFLESKYYSGEYFDKYTKTSYKPVTEKVKDLFIEHNFELPTQEDWKQLKEDVKQYGMYNAYLQAVPPTGSISYINHSTPSIHPVSSAVEIRKEGQTGRVYYPMPYLSEETLPYYKDAYELGWKALIDTYAVAQKHVDQSLSLTVFLNGGTTTREINKMQVYAWKKGIKTLYYVRINQVELKGTERECTSCVL